ncbi:unnamed protein product, partial [Didymodactylos carnosus]
MDNSCGKVFSILTQYNKRKDLILYGIPFKQNENTYDVVLELAASVELQLNKNDFYAIHRLPLSKRGKDKSRQAIIISFLRFTGRNNFYDARKKLRQIERYKDVFINGHLTPLNNHIFQYAKQNLNKQQVFTRNVCTWYGPFVDPKIADILPSSSVFLHEFKVELPDVEKLLR